jgi:formyltetrahydrofolate synthetase
MAKTQYSLSHDAALKGRPSGFRRRSGGPASAGADHRPRRARCGRCRALSWPGGENIDIDANGEIVGLL